MTTPKIHFGPGTLGNFDNTALTLAASYYALNDSDDAIAQSFQSPFSGTITDIGFSLASSTGTPPDYTMQIETLTTDRNPSGSLFGGSVTSFTPGSVGWHWITLDTPVEISAGDRFAAVLRPKSPYPDGSNHIRPLNTTIGLQSLSDFREYATGWSTGGDFGAMAVKFSDGRILGIAAEQFAALSSRIDVNTSPDEVGGLFTVPFDCTIVGVTFNQMYTLHGTQSIITLYNNVDEILYQLTSSASQIGWETMFLNIPPIALLADTNYRLTIGGATTTDIQPGGFRFSDSDLRATLPDGDRFIWTYRTNGGAWTDDPLRCPFLGLWLEDFS